MSPKWQDLPEDILFIIFQPLDRHALRSLRLVHRTCEKLAIIALYAELHLSPSLMSFQRMANVAASPDLSPLVRKLIYHPSPGTMGFVNQPYWFQRELCRLRMNISSMDERTWGPLSLDEREELENEIVKLRANIYVTTPPDLLGSLPFSSDQVWRLYDNYMNEALAQKSCLKLAGTRSFRQQIDRVLSAFPNLKHLQIYFRPGESRENQAPSRLDKPFEALLETRAGRMLRSISGMKVDWPEFADFIAVLPVSVHCLQNLQELQLSWGTVAHAVPQDYWSSHHGATGKFLQATMALRSLDLDFGMSPERRNAATQPLRDASSEIVLCCRWAHLRRLRLRGFLFGESAFGGFIDCHAKTLRVLELGDITLHPELSKDGTMLYPPPHPSLYRLFAQIQSSCSLERVWLRGRFSNGYDEVWCTDPTAWSRDTPRQSTLKKIEQSMCYRTGAPSQWLAEAFEPPEQIGWYDLVEVDSDYGPFSRCIPDGSWYREG